MNIIFVFHHFFSVRGNSIPSELNQFKILSKDETGSDAKPVDSDLNRVKDDRGKVEPDKNQENERMMREKADAALMKERVISQQREPQGPAAQGGMAAKPEDQKKTSNVASATKAKVSLYFNNTREADKHGPGLMGKSVVIPDLSAADQKRLDFGKQLHAFNEFASAKMSLHRTLPDARYTE